MTSRPSATPPPPSHLLGVLRSLWIWRKPILITTAVGTLLAVIISLLLPVYYQSTTSFVALNPEQNTIDGIFGASSGRINLYGNSDDIDRLLAVSESDELVDYMVRSFDLYRVYDIDSTKRRSPLAVRKEFLDNLLVEKSPRDIISVSIEDQDPERAAKMATAAREKINDIAVSITIASQRRMAESLEGELDLRDATLIALNDSLRNLRARSKVYNASAQSSALSENSSELSGSIAGASAQLLAYQRRGGRGARDSIAKLEVRLAGYRQAKVAVDSQLNALNESLGEFFNMDEERTSLNEALTLDRLRLKQLKTVLRNDQRVLEVVESARVPIMKSKPVRSLIVIGSAVFTFIAAVVGVLLIQSTRRYDWSAIFR